MANNKASICNFLHAFSSLVQVPVTNFFGSVMETIHTDSAYKFRQNKNTETVEIATPPEKSVADVEGVIEDASSNMKTKVINSLISI